MKLWVDDEREAPEGWYSATTYGGAIYMINKARSEGMKIEISLDHDLGEISPGVVAPNGYDVAKYIVEHEIDVIWHCHSQNVVGKKNIEQLLTRYDERRK